MQPQVTTGSIDITVPEKIADCLYADVAIEQANRKAMP
jgi:hypothetical protein